MDRRGSLIGVGALLAAIAQAGAEEMEQQHDHDHMHEHMHGGDNPFKSLVLASGDCVVKSELCLAHCVQLLSHGDASLSACARSVSQTQALCAALSSLAAQQSPLTPALARVTLDACKACEAECRKHSEHPECVACADSCVACIRECQHITG